jgi:hypothetical protein
MPHFDSDALLTMLRDPNTETQEIAAAAGVPREEAARAARLVLGLAKAKIEEILNLPTPLALAVLRAASASQRSDVISAAAVHANKDVAKEGKRALYLMKTRGVAVPEVARPTPAPLQAPPEPSLSCYASALDGHGERAIWLGRIVPGKGVEVAQAVISDQKGLLELHMGLLGRKEYRTFGKDLLDRGQSMGVAELTFEAAKGLVAAARDLNRTSGQAPPEGADAWIGRLGPAAPMPDPAASFPALPEEEERAAVEASGRLHDLPLIRGWLADEDALRSLAQKLDEIGVSALYIDEQQRAEAALKAVADATSAYFDDGRRALWAGRLFTTADHLARTGDAVHAGLAAAAGRALRRGIEVSQLPFARLLVEKAFPSAPEMARPSREASPLIVPRP